MTDDLVALVCNMICDFEEAKHGPETTFNLARRIVEKVEVESQAQVNALRVLHSFVRLRLTLSDDEWAAYQKAEEAAVACGALEEP